MSGSAPTSAEADSGLDDEQLRLIDAYWRAANYLSVGQIYLLDNRFCASRCEPST